MADLAACYFCGAALDDALGTVALADGASLTLCRSCREKLERVLDAADGGSVTESDWATGTDRATDPSNPTELAQDEANRESAAADPATETQEEPTAEPAAAATGDATTDEDRSVVEGDQDVSALEYNKVMRMLKNRDFPVDRDEFVAVAANAYQVSYTDCDRVIDAAIDQGLLDESDGRLVRPD